MILYNNKRFKYVIKFVSNKVCTKQKLRASSLLGPLKAWLSYWLCILERFASIKLWSWKLDLYKCSLKALAIMWDILDVQIFVTSLINYWELTVKIIIYSKTGN